MDIIILVITVVANLLLGAVVILRDTRSAAARSFGLMTLLISMWIVSNFLANHPTIHNVMFDDIVNRLAYFSGAGVLLSALLFTYYFPSRKIVCTTRRTALFIFAFCFLAISSTPFVAGKVIVSNGEVSYSVGPFLWLYVVAFLFTLLLITRNLLAKDSRGDVRQRKQKRFILTAFIVSAVLGLTTNAVLPLVGVGWDSTRYGPLVTVILVSLIAYTIIRHQLFDIKLAAVRSMAYVLALGVLAAIYYMMAYIVSVALFKSETTTSVSISPANIFLALILAFMFQPIKQFFDRLTDSIFYRDRYQSDEFFARISELLGSTTDLRGLLERTSTEIASTLKAEQAYFFLYYNNAIQHHMSAGTRRHSRMPVTDVHILDEYVINNEKGIIITDTLADDSKVRRMLISYKIALVMPLRYSGKLIGYVLLGEQQRTGGYNTRDLKVLNTISDQLVIGIQNALSIHAVKEINAHLQQRIDVATKELRSSNSQLRHIDEVKDEFMSMASHQLRTPLTSIKGYLSMVLEEDMGKITPQQRTVLNEAFNSSERMVRLIADFLNVSRLQTGKFIIEKNPADIVGVVRSEVESLKMIADSHDMKLAYTSNETELLLPIDEAKIRQVIMNFVDNAIYYSRPKSTIQVSLDRHQDEIMFKVIDTGIGVPASEQPMLFNKFFRAKNARQQRPDGTGVGLYLARKVITAHGGKMIFSSIEGEGSTFGFQLPIVKLED